jgi:YHS domain-containing protein
LRAFARLVSGTFLTGLETILIKLHSSVPLIFKGGFMAKDPVCGMSVEESTAAATSSYKGQTYYFCAKVCRESFDKEPALCLA